MKHTDLTLVFALYLTVTSSAQAQESLTSTTDYSSELQYYGENQPFAHPVPLSISTVPPHAYIAAPPQDFIPIASQHEFSDSRLPTVADATVRVFIRSYDEQRGVYINEEVLDPTCLLACLSRQGRSHAAYH
ncbi:hypothetical protein PSH58_11995 [Pseudomonas hefeiensis]|uniref:Uncharacterized protein n=1 Tax=Pseudomonas hefeiensis TaxID=2738125 RepID=A0ABY9GHD2_9PSED|nr:MULTISPECIES: hypothetical protein [unclassified Pseudomonas]WLH14957.1 hypothetical protein PSH57_11975 [Pseudomonas sp. FP205]WLH98006.1 hypothetical protein PSH58_11995 [Pseudomonas sp. FP53]WLI42282.1 hypothetical protein PSH74_11940 [Pseudomonas sp. FP821]